MMLEHREEGGLYLRSFQLGAVSFGLFFWHSLLAKSHGVSRAPSTQVAANGF